MIYDTSAFIYLAGYNKLDKDNFILDLTLYEVGNVIYKHIKKLKIMTPKETEKLLAIASEWPNIIRVEQEDLSKIETISVKLDLTFYDAAYLFYSAKHNMDLITSDRQMFEKSKKDYEVNFVEQR